MKYLIKKSKLQGEVSISGAKNSALRLLAASLLTRSKIKLTNFPSSIRDAVLHLEMLEVLGKDVIKTDEEVIEISEEKQINTELIWAKRSIRNTLLILGALLTRFGEGSVPLPGGCNLGERKYDLHEYIFKKLGAKVWVDSSGKLCATSEGQRLKGTDIYLPIRSTGATENGILCGTLAQGKTTIWNPHIRPEILDLIKMLKSMGANIKVYGQERIDIYGVDEIGGAEHEVILDNLEALTWLVGSVITDGDVEINNFPYNDLEIPLIFLRESGAQFYRMGERLIVRGGRPYPVEISTGPYPGVNSDMQPLFAIYGMCAQGISKIIDLRFPGRYKYAEELKKMGLEYKIDGNILIINGGMKVKGTLVKAGDLRAGAALALAGFVADGETVIEDAWQIDRGYNNFFQKLKSLNGLIDRVEIEYEHT